MNKLISENINSILNNRGISQTDLSSKSGVSRQTINLILSPSRDSNPKLSSLIDIASALNTDFPQLFTRNIDIEISFDSAMDLKSYMNVLIQNIKLNLPATKQKFLSSYPGISEATISELLNYKRSDIHISTILYISEQLNIPIDQLLKRGA